MSKLRMSGISKSFPGVKALDNVSFEANRGQIIGLVGVNGAGKSTLMNVLGGIYHPDEGDIAVDGQKVAFHSPKDATKHGIAFIHQELNVLDKIFPVPLPDAVPLTSTQAVPAPTVFATARFAKSVTPSLEPIP